MLGSTDRHAETTHTPIAAEGTDGQPTRLEAPVGQLLEMLTALQQLLKQLLELADRKLIAMRSADTDALQECAADEGKLLEAVFQRERQRKAVLARLAQSLRWPGGERARLGEIAERLPEPFSSRLRAKTVGLQQVATGLQRKNHLAAGVARNLHEHIRSVFADIAKANQESIVYGPDGKHEQPTARAWLDAVG
jgi:hypothetical protein